MKRSHQKEDAINDDEDAEMDVDDEDEEKAEAVDSEEELEEEDEDPAHAPTDVQFLDTFYGLSSPDGRERAQAAQAMLHFCLTGPDANAKDASYALRRLLGGICSGRAAARQGNASALATFLKIAFAANKFEEIRNEDQKKDEEAWTDLEFLRRRLIVATEPNDTKGKKRGSEERDYKFGRLFGILSVVRSGILVLGAHPGITSEDILQVSINFAHDLVGLYRYKKWMREPAAHAIGTLLNMFYTQFPEQKKDVSKVVDSNVGKVLVPEILAKGDREEGDTATKASSPARYSAEQIAIALNIQTFAYCHAESFNSPLDKPVLTKDTVPLLADALSETSSVTLPRTHLVWDAFWSFVSEPKGSSKSRKVDNRTLRDKCAFGNESATDLIEAIMKHVVMDKLLGLEQSENRKATHERRALALSIIRNLSGVEFVSSISGRTTISVPAVVFEDVLLKPAIVQRLFLDTICAGKGGPNQAAHLLKPLALQILDSITLALLGDNSRNNISVANKAKRLAVAKAFLVCDPRFDSKTKTSTVARLVHVAVDLPSTEDATALWQDYVTFLVTRIAMVTKRETKIQSRDHQCNPYEAQGYLDLLFHVAKLAARHEKDEKDVIVEQKAVLFNHIVQVLLSIAFFDCQNVTLDAAQTPGKKKKKKKKSTEGSGVRANSIVETAVGIREKRTSFGTPIPFEVRSAASARFFSLLSEKLGSIVHLSLDEKQSGVIQHFSHVLDCCDELEKAGATRHGEKVENIAEMRKIVHQLENEAKHSVGSDQIDKARKGLAVGCASLASALYLHLLSPGIPEDEMEDDDPDVDNEGDIEEIQSSIEDIEHVWKLYVKAGDDEANPLSGMAELCASILSSPLGVGNQSRGASPKLLREVVKLAWVGGLSMSAAEGNSAIHEESVQLLLSAIGAVEHGEGEDMSGDGDGDNEDDSDARSAMSEDSDVDGNVFVEAGELLRGEPSSIPSPEKSESEDEVSDKEIELDATKLQTMLEEDDTSDVEEELEHHEGADAALAKLIQLRQEARKAGQLARERIEIARQLRCFVLIETLILGKAESWGALLRAESIMEIVIAILRYRKRVEKSLSRANEKGKDVGMGERHNLLERLTTLLKTKVLKVKLAHLRWSDSVEVRSYADNLTSVLVSEAKTSTSKEQQNCCNTALIMLLRSIPNIEQRLEVANAYHNVATEWSTTRLKGIESDFFDHLIHHSPVLAQAVLIPAFVVSTTEARSPFLKCESFRLLTTLYGIKAVQDEPELERIANAKKLDAAEKILDSISTCLQDDEMRKAKRAREMLRAGEKVISFVTSSASGDFAVAAERKTTLIDRIGQLRDSSESQGLQKMCDDVLKAVESIPLRSETSAKEDMKSDNDTPSKPQPRSSSKKSKKKKKKR